MITILGVGDKLGGESIFWICAYCSPRDMSFELLTITIGLRASLLWY